MRRTRKSLLHGFVLTLAGAGLACLTLTMMAPPALAVPRVLFRPLAPLQSEYLQETVVATADFNGDGHLDIVWTTYWGARLGLGDGHGQFAEVDRIASDAIVPEIQASDVDHDGDVDLVVVSADNVGSANVQEPQCLRVYLNNGDGTFVKAVDRPLDKAPRSVTSGDFNGDGQLDVAIGQMFGVRLVFGVLSQEPSETTLPLTNSAGGMGNWDKLVAGDIDGDGDTDLAAAEYYDVTTIRNDGAGNFTQGASHYGHDTSRSLALNDVDADGLLDVVLPGHMGLIIWHGTPACDLERLEIVGNEGLEDLAMADFDGDGLLDFASAPAANRGQFKVFLRSTSGWSVETIGPATWPGEPRPVASGDFDEDGRPDVLVVSSMPLDVYPWWAQALIVWRNVEHENLPPSTEIHVDRAPDLSGWFRTSPWVSLTATDDPTGWGMGVSQYRLDGASWTTYTGPIIVTDGHRTFDYRSIDAAGNVEETRTLTFDVDTMAPVTLCPSQTSYTGNASIVLEPNDPSSGIGSFWSSIDDGPETPETHITVSGAGPHSLKFSATDLAGNIEPVATRTFSVLATTTVTLTAKPTSTAYAGPSSIAGSVKASSSSGLVATGTVTIQSSPSGTSGWVNATKVTTNATGAFSFTARPTSKTWYRAVFDGRNDWLAPSTSASVFVVPSVSLSAVAGSRVSTRTYNLYGSLKPRHTRGSRPVRMYVWRRVSSGWKSYGYVWAVAYDYNGYTRYKVRKMFAATGYWRLRAYHPADASNAASYSAYSYLTVR